MSKRQEASINGKELEEIRRNPFHLRYLRCYFTYRFRLAKAFMPG